MHEAAAKADDLKVSFEELCGMILLVSCFVLA